MSDGRAAVHRPQPGWVTAWFILDAVVALAPPLYWYFDGNVTPVFGVPAAVVYFVAVATCIAASIVAAYIADRRAGEFA